LWNACASKSGGPDKQTAQFKNREDAVKAIYLAFLTAVLAFLAALDGSSIAQAQIVVIGDSNIAGKGVASSDNYPSKLERALHARGYKGTVINAGINGDTTQGVLSRLDSDVPAGTKVAIVWIGVNDIRRHGASVESVKANKQEIANRLRARGIKVIMLGHAYHPTGHPELLQNDSDQHLNAAGYDTVVARTLPQVEAALGQGGDKRH
jgi:acyl-CoA thioesterase I